MLQRLGTGELGAIKPFEEAWSSGMAAPQFAEPHVECLGAPATGVEISKIPEELDRLVVLLRPLRLDERLDVAPDVLLALDKGVEIGGPRRRPFRFAACSLFGLPLRLLTSSGIGSALGPLEQRCDSAPARGSVPLRSV